MCVVLAFVANPPLHAQEAQEEEGRATLVEEVVVTAQKRDEDNLQDLPVALSTFTAEDLEANKVVEFGEIVNLAPSVTLRKQSASHSNYAFGMRGVTSGETQLTIDPVVAVYVDGVYLGRQTGSAFDISDTERVEVLRGPQGTLYGRNATGGVINIISTTPERSFGLRNHFSGGERGFWRNQFTINSSVVKVLDSEIMLRVNFSKWKHRGLIRNEPFVSETQAANVGPTVNISGGFIGDQDSEAFRILLHYVYESFSLDYVYDRSTKFGNAQITQLTALNDYRDPAGVSAEYEMGTDDRARSFWGSIQDSGYVQDEHYQVSKFYDQPEIVDVEGHSLTRVWQLSAVYKFKSIIGVREWESTIDDFGTDFGSFLASAPAAANLMVDHDFDPNTDRVAMSRPNVGGVVDQLAVQTGDQAATLSANAAGQLVIPPSGGQGEFRGFLAAGVPVSLFRASRFSRQEQMSMDYQFIGLSFDEHLDWVLGFYYFEEEADEHNAQHTAAPARALLFQYRVRSALDTVNLWASSDNIDTDDDGVPDTMMTFPEYLDFIGELPSGFDTLSEAERPAARAAITDALGYTFRGHGNGYLCSGKTGLTVDEVTPVPADYGTGIGPFASYAAEECDGVTVLGGSNIFNYGTDNKAWALYWNGRIHITDSVTLALGLRYTEDDRAAYLEYEPIQSGQRVNASEDWESLTWDISVDWQIVDNVNFYGRMATSYRAGGYNARAFSAADFQTPFDEEYVTSLELGVKTRFADDKARINAAIYVSKWTDAQVATFVPSLAGATTDISNAGELFIGGFELELLTVPFTGFTLGFNIGVLESEYDRFAEGNRPLMAELRRNGLSEPEVAYSPEISWSFFVDYQFPRYSWGQLGLRLDANYADQFTISPVVPLDDPINDDTDRTLVNMSITLAEIPVRHGNFSVSLWSRNLTNEEYREFVIPFGIFDAVSYGELRRSGFDIVWSY